MSEELKILVCMENGKQRIYIGDLDITEYISGITIDQEVKSVYMIAGQRTPDKLIRDVKRSLILDEDVELRFTGMSKKEYDEVNRNA